VLTHKGGGVATGLMTGRVHLRDTGPRPIERLLVNHGIPAPLHKQQRADHRPSPSHCSAPTRTRKQACSHGRWRRRSVEAADAGEAPEPPGAALHGGGGGARHHHGGCPTASPCPSPSPRGSPAPARRARSSSPPGSPRSFSMGLGG
jgi:hypothetical protein